MAEFIPSYFGEPWPSGVCDEGVQVKTPTGKDCLRCEVPIKDGDQGQLVTSWTGAEPVHKECMLRMVMGSVAHMEGRCRCRGEDAPYPETPEQKRQDAVALWEWVEERRRVGDYA